MRGGDGAEQREALFGRQREQPAGVGGKALVIADDLHEPGRERQGVRQDDRMTQAAGLLQRPDTLLTRPFKTPQKSEVQRKVGPRGHVRVLPEQGGRGGERQRIVERRRLLEMRRGACDLPPRPTS